MATRRATRRDAGLAEEAAALLRERRRRAARRAHRRRRDEARLGPRRRRAPTSSCARRGLDADRRAQRRATSPRSLAGRACRSRARRRRSPRPGRCWRSTRRSATGAAATIGGVVAAGDSGPLRHRYGGAPRPRDRRDGRARRRHGRQAGGKVIKNVAGYDLAQALRRLVRDARADRRGRGAPAPAARPDRAPPRRRPTIPDALAARRRRARARPARGRAASTSRWADGRGRRARALRAAPPRPPGRARRAALAGSAWRPRSIEDDDAAVGRAARGPALAPERRGRCRVVRRARATLRVGRAAERLRAPRVVGRAGARALVAGARAPRGRRAAEAVGALRGGWRRRRASCSTRRPTCAPRSTRGTSRDRAALALMRRVKERFDPAGTLQPGPVRGRDLMAAPGASTTIRAAAARADRRLRPLRLLPADVPDLRRCGARRWTRRAGGSC